MNQAFCTDVRNTLRCGFLCFHQTINEKRLMNVLYSRKSIPAKGMNEGRGCSVTSPLSIDGMGIPDGV